MAPRFLSFFRHRPKGAMLTEYGLVVGLIAVFALFAVGATGTVVRDIFNNSSEQLAGVEPVASTPPSGGGGGGQGVVTPVEDRSFTVTFAAPNPGPAFIGTAFSYDVWTLATVSGPGTILAVNPITLASLSWSLDASSPPLPDGLTLSASGVLSGVPTTAATPTLVVRASAEGTGFTVDIPLSITIPPFEVEQVAYAGGTYCAISTDGELRCWGTGNNGLRGDGQNGTASLVSVRIGTSSDTFTKVDVGGSAACAIHTNTQLWCWGAGNNGLSGQGTHAPGAFTLPQPVVTFVNAAGGGSISNSGVTHVSMGPTTTPSIAHACLVANGAAYCWGGNDYRQLGGTAGNVSRPRQVATTTTGGATVQTVEARSVTSCFFLTASPWGECVGAFPNGAMAITGSGVVATVTPMGSISSSVRAAEGRCAWRTNGTIGCWGQNNLGQVGQGTGTGTFTAVTNVSTHDPDASAAGHVTGVIPGSYVDYTAGEATRCILTAVGAGNQLYCWGGSNSVLTRPTRVVLPFLPVDVAASNVESNDTTLVLVDEDGNLHTITNLHSGAPSTTQVVVPNLGT